MNLPITAVEGLFAWSFLKPAKLWIIFIKSFFHSHLDESEKSRKVEKKKEKRKKKKEEKKWKKVKKK